jgi:hypothetical protein
MMDKVQKPSDSVSYTSIRIQEENRRTRDVSKGQASDVEVPR